MIRLLLICCCAVAALPAADGFINVDLLTLRSVLADGVAVYESQDAFLTGERPLRQVPDRSIATLLSWVLVDGKTVAAKVSIPQGNRFAIVYVACGDIAKRETLRLPAPCAMADTPAP